MFETAAIVWIAGTFLLAGVVKGVIGMGLPLIAVGVLTAIIGLHPAMALMLAPALVTNVWQGFAGGQATRVAARIWPFLLVSTLAIPLGAMALTRVDVRLLSALLGFLLAAYGIIGLIRPPFRIAPASESWSGLAAGLVNGIFAGMTGSFSIPGVPWLQAIGLSRDQLIQAMGMLFSLSSVALALAMGGQNLLGRDLAMASVLSIIPALAGMMLGQAVRQRLSETQFRNVFFVSLIALGLYIAAGLVLR